MEQKLAFDLLEVPQGESHREVPMPAEALGLELPDIRFLGPLDIRLDLYRSGDSIRIQGEFRGRFAYVCGRCLAEGEREFTGRADIYCEKKEGELEEEDREALEEGGLVYHDGKVLDLFEEIRQTMVLEIPWNPVCRPDCRGLCPRCGQDLNKGSCGCAPETDSRWASLKNLLG
jgi:uncharacterized protein